MIWQVLLSGAFSVLLQKSWMSHIDTHAKAPMYAASLSPLPHPLIPTTPCLPLTISPPSHLHLTSLTSSLYFALPHLFLAFYSSLFLITCRYAVVGLSLAFALSFTFTEFINMGLCDRCCKTNFEDDPIIATKKQVSTLILPSSSPHPPLILPLILPSSSPSSSPHPPPLLVKNTKHNISNLFYLGCINICCHHAAGDCAWVDVWVD